MVQKRMMRQMILPPAVVAALILGGTAMAQPPIQTNGAPTRTGHAPVTVDIPAQPLRSALDQFAAQTGLQVAYAGTHVVRGLHAPAVSGTLAPDVILRRLLAPSGLHYHFVNAHTVTISKPHRRPSSRESAHQRTGISTATGQHMDITLTSESAKKAAQMGTITVIGTNLGSIDPASPLITIGAQQIEAGGYSSIEDVLRHLPQNFSSRTSASTAMGETEYGSSYLPISSVGSDSVNLRGLGSRSTLILVNGHRVAGSAQGQGAYTDISSIPLSQVARIEVLTDGASAIYGADAVAGVVNIVLKKQYSGTVIELRHEDSSTDANASRLNIAHTFSWNRGYLTATGTFRKSKPADVNSFVHVGPAGRGDFTDMGGLNARLPDLGQPGVVFDAIDQGFGFYARGMPLGLIPAGQDGKDLQPDDLLAYDPARAPSVYSAQRIGPEITKPALRLNGEQDFGKTLKLTWSASYARQKNTEYWHPLMFDFGFLKDGSTTLVPASNPYNHFGKDVLVGYSYANEFGGMTFSQHQRQTNRNLTVGLSGQLPFTHSWHFDIDYIDSRERGNSDILAADLAMQEDAASQQRLAHVLNHLDVFGDGAQTGVVDANRQLLDSLVGSYTNTFDSHLRSIDAKVRGDLFSLPAGNARLAFGVQYRDQKYHFLSTFQGGQLSDSTRKDHALFAELGIPLLRDVPGAEDLHLTLAARYESFDQRGTNSLLNQAFGFDENFNPVDLVELGGFDMQKLAGAPAGAASGSVSPVEPFERTFSNTSRQARLAWQPVDTLTLRATWGQSFLIPDARQLFGQEQAYDGTFAVQFNGGTIPPGVNDIIQLSGPNPHLKPQRATVKTVGFNWYPAFADGLSLAATYNDTHFKNYIGDPLAGLSYAKIFANLDKMPPETFIRGDHGVLLWDARQVNFLKRRSRTIDTQVQYGFSNASGHWNLKLNAVRTLELSAQTLPQLPTVVFSDSEFGPSKWVTDLFVSWNKNGFLASAGAHYSSAFRVLQPESGEATILNDFMPNPHPRYHAGSYTTMDFQVGYQWHEHQGWLSRTTIRLGAQDIFNRAFPFVDNQFGFISNRSNPRGRVVYLDLKKRF
jgi:outer membrane receptor protein involved in Fe transport